MLPSILSLVVLEGDLDELPSRPGQATRYWGARSPLHSEVEKAPRRRRPPRERAARGALLQLR